MTSAGTLLEIGSVSHPMVPFQGDRAVTPVGSPSTYTGLLRPGLIP